MNTLHKSLSTMILAVFIFISGLNGDFIGAQDTAVIKATSRRSADLLLSRYLRFGRLTTEDGLSSDQAYHVAQDSYGFMWFATADGLSRYDGASIKVYRRDPDDPSSLGNNAVRAMIADQS
jgi:ligand-binding sensor domain-containing protein